VTRESDQWQRFLALAPERTGTGSITVVQNWRAAAGLGQ
jgi:hypothetical protein